MTTRHAVRTETPRIGVRPVDEVESAYRTLAAEATGPGRDAGGGRALRDSDRPRALREGATEAYRWALARAPQGPITGVRGRDVPDVWRLTAEVDAAAVLLDDPACPHEAREYVRGVHDALAWLCGHSDQRV
ncbi:hypothetical protein ATE80_30075 [Streptomyces kanasensis]|uniref:Uncharacterized protein n=1 Tax=Streptomyces kanasensis TaxID=936756 RepID=A0A100Y0E1_9ACTN|nr:hypothetical protein ATE80_30075 [Streptomyces kanasensis]